MGNGREEDEEDINPQESQKRDFVLRARRGIKLRFPENANWSIQSLIGPENTIETIRITSL